VNKQDTYINMHPQTHTHTNTHAQQTHTHTNVHTFSQKMAQKEPEKWMPSTHAKATKRSEKERADEIHFIAHSALRPTQGTVWIAENSMLLSCTAHGKRWHVVGTGCSFEEIKRPTVVCTVVANTRHVLYKLQTTVCAQLVHSTWEKMGDGWIGVRHCG